MLSARFSGSSSVPNTSFSKALASDFGVCRPAAPGLHQKYSFNLPGLLCILNSVEPVTSKKRLLSQRAASAASSYQGLPRWAPMMVSFGKARAIEDRKTGRMRAKDDLVALLGSFLE